MGNPEIRDVLEKKQIDFQIEKAQIVRILPELDVLIKKVETSKSQVRNYLINKLIFHPEDVTEDHETGDIFSVHQRRNDKGLEYASKNWSELVETVSKTNEYIRYLISQRIFNIQHERKEIIDRTFVSEIDSLLKKMPKKRYEAFKVIQKLERVLSEVEIFFESFIKNYTYLLRSK